MIQLNALLFIFLALYLLQSCTQTCLHRLNLTYLRRKGNDIPELLQDLIDGEKLKKISAYTGESEHFSMMATLFDQTVSLAILLSGLLSWLVNLIQSWGFEVITGGLVFFAILSAVTHLLRLPFGFYDTFVIEGRYGFNTVTPRMWLADLAKGLIIVTVLGGLILGFLMVLLVCGGTTWWVWTWMVLGAFEWLLLWLFPVVIAPLFNKFDPIEDKTLERQIENLMDQVGLRVKGVFQMDASKRSRHTNAYFTGIGKSKRVVLFDTLLTSHTKDEILAVLAHEIGHWKRKHLLKQLVPLELLSLVGLYLVARLLDWPLLYETFGLETSIPYGGLYLIGALISPLAYFVHPAESWIARRFEREADDFSVKLLGNAEPLRGALKRLATDNLSNLTPHPLYAWFYYSHPPLIERISRLRDFG
ncbi:MAG: M48 family metallopeptidase [Desulfobacterales bacterium]|nr:M48 family metallopeptidase [Desulfobacterales bacterium]